MNNFDIARDVLDVSSNSDGSAMAEHAKWLDSIEAKMNQLKAAWQGLSQAFLDDSLLKVLIDSGTFVVSSLEQIIRSVGSLKTALIGFGAFKIIKDVA